VEEVTQRREIKKGIEGAVTDEAAEENYEHCFLLGGAHGGVVVKALRYKPAGRGFDSRWCHWNFSVT
jgi:hypothetical protein